MASTHTLIAATILATAVLAWPVHAAEPDAPKTFEDQINYLEGALAESIRTRDFTMLELAAKGFKASKLEGKDLELSILRAERDAAWGNAAQTFGGAPNSAALEAWGLMARAKIGSDPALATLRKLAAELPPAPEPVPSLKQAKAADYHAKQAAQNIYNAKVRLHEQAFFVLALMKEPGIQDKALAAIKARSNANDDQVRTMLCGSDPLALAVLEPDADAGFKRLVAFCEDDKNGVKAQVVMLGELHGLLASTDFLGVDEQFSAAAAIRKRLPKDARQQLLAPFVGVLKRYKPEGNQGWDATLNYITNISMDLDALPPEGVDAIEALVNKLPGPREQYPKQSFIALLKKYGKDMNAPIKPPKPPTE